MYEVHQKYESYKSLVRKQALGNAEIRRQIVSQSAARPGREGDGLLMRGIEWSGRGKRKGGPGKGWSLGHKSGEGDAAIMEL